MKMKNVLGVYQQLMALIRQCDDGVVDKAAIAAKLKKDGYQAAESQLLALAERIYEVCISTDEPRFTWYDYADAIINWPARISIDLLLNLSDEDFEEIIVYMAIRKRETYSADVRDACRGEALIIDLQRKSAQQYHLKHRAHHSLPEANGS